MDRAQKRQEVTALSERFSKAKAAFLIDFKGMNVEQVTTLRKGLHPLEAEMKVVRNTLARLALKDHPEQDQALGDKFLGTNAVIFAYDDVSAPAKFLNEFGKDVDQLQIKTGVMEGQALDEAKIKYLATLPTMDVLRAQFLGTLAAPATKFVQQLAAPASSFARLLSAYKDTKSA